MEWRSWEPGLVLWAPGIAAFGTARAVAGLFALALLLDLLLKKSGSWP